MNGTVIEVERLGKQYHIGKKEERYRTLRDTVWDGLRAPFRRVRGLLAGHAAAAGDLNEAIWALRNVSFEVKQGEVLGIIGRNGAGKSTLLKILSRITEPTEGCARIRGRVASLLEVGTGFHPELTGRDNLYMNGAILGMTRREIDRKYDEIVAFAGVEPFIDTPVKHYSSGMYLRLAFAVAAHLEPEILVMDEVLAVGDSAFQKKCLGKLEQVAGGGRTVLFVSHNLLAVEALCTRALVLENGKVAFEGAPREAISVYSDASFELQTQEIATRTDRKGGETVRITSVDFLDPDTLQPHSVLKSGDPTTIRIGYRCAAGSSTDDLSVNISFNTSTELHLFGCSSRAVGVTLDASPGEHFTDCRVGRWPLKPGRYNYNVYAETRGRLLDLLQGAGVLDVVAADFYGTGVIPNSTQPGMLIDYDWVRSPTHPALPGSSDDSENGRRDGARVSSALSHSH